jgi:hypothetical protein
MRILVVGGVERTEGRLQQAAEDLGHELEFHGGHMDGRGADGLRAAVDRADFVIVVTEVNSHGAVQVARQEARRSGRTAVVVRRCSPARLRSLVAELELAAAHAG